MKRFIILLLFSLQLSGVVTSQNTVEYYENGIAEFNKKNFESSINFFTKAINDAKGIEATLAHLYLWRGKAKYYSEQQDNQHGLDDFIASLNLRKNQLEPYKYLSFIYAKNKQVSEACKNLDLAIVNGLKCDSAYYWPEFTPIQDSQSFSDVLDKHNIIHGYSYSLEIKRLVELKINSWQKKGKFEKTTEYQKRVTEDSRSALILKYTKETLDSIALSKIDLSKTANEYDADNESFKIRFDDISPIVLKIPMAEAESFDNNFKDLKYIAPSFTLSQNELFVLHIEISNPGNGKTYIYDSQDVVAFAPTQLALNFDEIDFSIPNQKSAVTSNPESTARLITVGKSDVDINIPVNSSTNTNRYALIIGNEDYTKYQTGLNSEANVQFAINDAKVFAEYAEKTLGIPKENIKVVFDAIGSVMKREIERIIKMADLTNGEIIFYYAGHGFPDELTKESYIMPVDIGGANVKDGIRLSTLYIELSGVNISKASIFIDACFSGGGRNLGLLAARGVKIKPKEDVATGNLIVFSATSEDQVSLPYIEKQHGMFTYFLLKKMQESKGDVTYKELSEYIKNQVQLYSLKINYKEQTPNINISSSIIDVWQKWKLR